MFVTAYYFRAHTYTIVPRHVREDMEWMADHGTDAISIGVLEQDLFAAIENYQIICEEARRVGMQTFATPSRWGGLVAGCPKVPSIFCARHPEAAVRNPDGSPLIDWIGTKASVHHPATFAFFCSTTKKMLDLLPLSGIIWDEVKTLEEKDFSDAAKKALTGKNMDDLTVHIDATANFFDAIGGEALKMKPDLKISMFLYASLHGYPVERCAKIRNLHYFGCDGRPFGKNDMGQAKAAAKKESKFLCDTGPYFAEVARKNGKGPLWLVENHALKEEDVPAMDKRLPEILSMDVEHLIYYYYPRSLKDPDRNMNVIGGHLKKIKG
ncbi:MAG TPA: hypothetical protein DCZ94_15610 [Lentisphaeria bacterium]|nr:MAG: hypothetical protein A2X48_17005 [Lentisphaerae bacterium GWF2_49_21]HBC88375.1 hypothetical protein [Lentisphaeria bacterium]